MDGYARLAAAVEAAAGKLSAARKHYRKILREEPGDRRALVGLAVPAAVAGLSPLPVEGEVSGLVLRVEGKVQPRLRVRLRGKARTVSAGFPGDPVGSGGVAWFHDEASALAWPGVGPKPRLATARVRGGVLELVDTDAAVLDGVPGGLALVSP